MKKYLLKIGSIVMLLFIIGSCKKDYQNGEVAKQGLNNRLQQWYDSNLEANDQNPFGKLKPNWETVYTAQVGAQTVYEIGFASTEKLMVRNAKDSPPAAAENLDVEAQRHNVKLLLFEDALTGQVHNAAYMAIESSVSANLGGLHYKDLGNFTGKVYFHHLNGKLSNGWVYQNGKITAKLSPSTQAQYNYEQKLAALGKQTNAITCYTSYADNYMYVCVYIDGYYSDCRWQYAGSSYYSACSFTEQSSIGDGNGGGGGYTDQSLKPDCAGVLGGTAYIDLNCNECIGGTTGKTACTFNSEDPGKLYELTIVADPLVLAKRFECFNNVLTNSTTTYSIRICTDIPVNSNPKALLDNDRAPGHAFIELTKTNGSNSVTETIGFYPQSATKAAFQLDVNSMIADNQFHEYDASYFVTINAVQFQQALITAKNSAANDYNMTGYNCTTFALDVFNSTRALNNQLIVPNTIPPNTIFKSYGQTPNGLYQKIKEMTTNNVIGAVVAAGTGAASSKCN
jgi:hypothetical protein